MGRFEGKRVLITGSSSGIGAETARHFAREGANVVVNSSSSVEAGEAVAAELDALDGSTKAVYVQGNIADPDQRTNLVDRTIEELGGLDVLVNNAGVTRVIPHHDLDAVTPEIFREILEVNVLSTFEMTKLAMPHLQATGDGVIVNVTSIAGVRQTGSSVPYAVSKAALNHLTELIANVVGPTVRVNAVAPGLVKTPWTKDWGPLHDAMKTMTPLGRSAEAEDIAEVILDLASASYLTGQIVVVDGGMGLRN